MNPELHHLHVVWAWYTAAGVVGGTLLGLGLFRFGAAWPYYKRAMDARRRAVPLSGAAEEDIPVMLEAPVSVHDVTTMPPPRSTSVHEAKTVVVRPAPTTGTR